MIQNVYFSQGKGSVTFSIPSSFPFRYVPIPIAEYTKNVALHSNWSLAIHFCSFVELSWRRCVRSAGLSQTATSCPFLAYILKPIQLGSQYSNRLLHGKKIMQNNQK